MRSEFWPQRQPEAGPTARHSGRLVSADTEGPVAGAGTERQREQRRRRQQEDRPTARPSVRLVSAAVEGTDAGAGTEREQRRQRQEDGPNARHSGRLVSADDAEGAGPVSPSHS